MLEPPPPDCDLSSPADDFPGVGDRAILDGRYRLTHVLGRGGTGTTYRATDLQDSDRPVAIKVLSLRDMGNWDAIRLFEREVSVLAGVNHPAIPRHIRSFQVDRADNRLFCLVQELAEGQSLARLLAKGWRPDEAEVRAIAAQVLEVLCYLHRLNPPIVHRDIKPQNLIYHRDGRVFLIDFGAVQNVYRRTVLGHNTFVGTLGYMPPEQYRGVATGAADLYALGATLVHLLTGRSPNELPEQRLKLQFRAAAAVSDELAQWLDGLLEPSLERRTQSAIAALRQLRGETKTQPPRRFPRDRANPSGALRISPSPYPQPAGSRVRLMRTDRHLSIVMPYRLAGVAWPGVVLLVLVAGGCTFASGTLSLLLVWGALSAAGLLSLLVLASQSSGKCKLSMDAEQFRLRWSIGGIRWYRKGRCPGVTVVQGPHALRLEASTNRVHPPAFGSGVSDIERDWLRSEIHDFLDEQRDRDRPPE